MPKTRGAVRGEVRGALNEISASFWTDTQLNNWINEACRDMSRRAENLDQIATVVVTAGLQDYDAPADLIRAHRMEYTPNAGGNIYPLEPRSLAEMDQYWGINQTQTQSYPSFWTERKSPPTLSFRLWPNPASSGSLYIYYHRLAADIADGAGNDGINVDTAEGWYDLIVDYAEYRAKRKDNDPTWKDAKGIYEEKLNDMIEVTRKYNDEAGVMVTKGGVGIPSWLYGQGDY